MKKEKKKDSCLITSLIIIAIICALPFVLLLGWIAGIVWLIAFRKRMGTDPKKQKKYTIGISAASALSLLIFVYSMATAPPTLTSLTLSSSAENLVLEINTDYDIHLQYAPEDASLSSIEYKISDPSLADIISDSNTPNILTLHTKGEGTVTVTAVKGSVESNALSFDIMDSARIEQEKTAESEQVAKNEDTPDSEQAPNVEASAAVEESPEDITASEETDSQISEEKAEESEPLGFNVVFSKTYRNDKTGNWRLSKIAENISIEEYAVDYYKNYFEKDNEVHIIINFALNTTTRITVMGDLLDVAVMEYIDKEEHDASLACSGTLLEEYHVNINTGKVEKLESQDVSKAENNDSNNQPEKTSAQQTDTGSSEQTTDVTGTQTADSSAATQSDTSSGTDTGATSTGNNFNTYDNPDQQQTADAYVLNTSSHKIHYPNCSSVAKIAPKNYSTSNASLEELMSQGYTTCGICLK